MTIQELLEVIAALPEAERRDLLSRLREIYGSGGGEPPAAPAGWPSSGSWEREADFMIVFDGGSQGNPGPAYGSYALVNARGDIQVERLTFDQPLTNNEAEYHTLLTALHALQRRVSGRVGRVVVVIRGDSQLVIEQVSGRWQVREARLRPLCDEIQQLLGKFQRWRLLWQPREETARLLGH